MCVPRTVEARIGASLGTRCQGDPSQAGDLVHKHSKGALVNNNGCVTRRTKLTEVEKQEVGDKRMPVVSTKNEKVRPDLGGGMKHA